jgi:iron-sulfur cluster repair protein YtfE (RIC family)
MDAISLLTAQHAEVKSLFSRFKKTVNPTTREALFAELADELAAHCEIEEKLFYPAVFRADLQEPVREAVEEHLSAKRVIADLMGMEPTEVQYQAKMAVLEELVTNHVEEEEDSLFPAAREGLERQELEAIGEEMRALFEKLRGTSPRHVVPSQIARAAALPDDEGDAFFEVEMSPRASASF